MEWWMLAGLITAIILVLLVGFVAMIAKFYRKVDQGKALIINKMKHEPEVTFTGGTVYPIFHRAEVMDISVKTIEIERRGGGSDEEGLICADNIRADIKVNFYIRVNKSVQDVLRVAQSIGCARASDLRTLQELFSAKFSEALKTAGKKFEFEELYTKRQEFRDKVLEVIGDDLNGYILEDVAIDYLEQTPVSKLDPKNVLDAKGIEKITQITATKNITTEEIRQRERMDVGAKQLEADEAIFTFDSKRAKAEAKKDREISVAREQEENEALRLKHQEQKKTVLAKQVADQEIAEGEQGKMRAVEISQKDRERAVQIKTVEVQKARDLAEIERENEVEVKRFEKNERLEEKKESIARTIKKRIEVERGVAEEEEAIKDVRVLKDAGRQKEARLINAAAEAEELHVKQIKAAEAAERVAEIDAKKLKIAAQTQLDTSDLIAKSKAREAEGIQAERSAEGIAEAMVKERMATALEKEGLAQARILREQKDAEAVGLEKIGMAKVEIRKVEVEVVEREGRIKAELTREQLLAEAAGEEEKGMAQTRISRADAEAFERRGLAEATAIREKLAAEAEGAEKRGMGLAKVQLAEADALERRGLAEAAGIREKLVAEAAGLAQKAEAMKALDGVGREHEEFRIRLEAQKEIRVAEISTRKEVAVAQAEILSQAFAHTKIDIVGGDGAFFDRFMNAVTLGRSVDGFIDNSDATRTVLKDYFDGDGSLNKDLRDILSRPAISSEGVQSLTISALLGRLMVGADEDARGKLRALIGKARELGVDRLDLGQGSGQGGEGAGGA